MLVTMIPWGLAGVVGLLLAVLAPFALLTPRAPRAPRLPADLGTLEAHLGRLTAHETPPALTVMVVNARQALYARAFGVADGVAGRAAAIDDLYHFWSVTKLVTATAVLQLVEAGTVGLDDPVTRHLPAFTTRLKSGKSAVITIRQLLAHTSGMRNLAPQDLIGWIHHPWEPSVSESTLVAERMGKYRRLAARPGERSVYSNAGYIVLGAVIEAATGIGYEEYVRTRILTPLRMSSTDFVYPSAADPRIVAGTHPVFHLYTPLLFAIHRDWLTGWVRRVRGVRRLRMWFAPLLTDYTAPTALIGTAGDLARFAQAYLRGGELDGARILAPGSVRQLLDEGYGLPSGAAGERLGLGWHCWTGSATPFKGHGGEGPGFAAQLALFPERDLAIVLLANDTLIDRVGLTELVASAFR